MARFDPTLPDELKKDGYSKEEKYFHDINRELIEARLERHPLSNEPQTAPSHRAPQAPHGLRHWLRKLFGVREGSQELF
jgi:hypothetical protein